MGTSTNAVLAFGFDMGIEDGDVPESLLDLFEEVDQDFDKILILFNNPELTVEEVEEMDYTERKNLLEQVAFEVDTHCSLEYPMYFLAIRGTVQSAPRGEPSTISLHVPENMEGRLKSMREFCDKYDIEWKCPQWHIYSMWS